MKLRTKLIASFTGVIILLLAIGGASQYFNDQIKDQVIDESKGAVQELQVSARLESYLFQSLVNTQYYLDEPFRETLSINQRESTLSVEKIRENVRASIQGIQNSLNYMEAILKSDENSLLLTEKAQKNSLHILEELRTRVLFYNSLIQQAISYKEGNFEDGKEFFVVTIEPFFRNNLLPLVEQFRSQIRTNLDNQVGQLNAKLNTYSNILLLATTIAFIFALGLAFMLYRSIASPIQLLVEGTQEIGRGNLEKRIEIDSNDELGQLGMSFNRMAENLNKITFSKEYVDDVIESMGDALIVTDENAHITKVNTRATMLLGYSVDELTGTPLATILADKDKKNLLSLDDISIKDNYETSFILKNGKRVPVSLSKAFIHNNDGSIQGIVCVASDITKRKEAEQVIQNSLREKEILLAEIHHRVKNNLAVISGLLQMQIWEAENETVEGVLKDSQMRVKSIALVHEKLYQSEDLSHIEFDKYINELLEGIEQTYRHEDTDVRFETDIEPVIININQAIPCSLLLNELVVNAYKHAFVNSSKGLIYIQLKRDDSMIELLVKDDGVGLDDSIKSSGSSSLGMSLINTLVKQLNGKIESHNDGGALFRLTFELPDK